MSENSTAAAKHGAWTPEGEVPPAAPRRPSEDTIISLIKTVFDPEIPVNIYDLGLVYTIQISDEGAVEIVMTLTAPGCPVAGEMPVTFCEA